MAKTKKARCEGLSLEVAVDLIFALPEPKIPDWLLGDGTAECIEQADQSHPLKRDKIRAKKRYVTASAEGKAAIERALHERRLRRIKALWAPEENGQDC